MATCSVHKLIAGVVVIAGAEALLVKYKDTDSHDGQTGWFHPDETLTDFEEPGDGALRILRDQLGLPAKRLAFGFFESFGGHDGTHHLMFHYKVTFPKPPAVKPGNNVGSAKWFELSKLPPKSEFAHHGWSRDVILRVVRGTK